MSNYLIVEWIENNDGDNVLVTKKNGHVVARITRQSYQGKYYAYGVISRINGIEPSQSLETVKQEVFKYFDIVATEPGGAKETGG